MDSFSTQNIKQHRNIVFMMLVFPLVTMMIVAGVLYRGNTHNNNASAAASQWDFSNVTSAGNAGGKDISAFTTFQEAAPGRLSFVTSPVAPGHQLSARVETQQNDVPSTTACCRAEFMDWRRAGSLPNQVGIVVPNSDYYYSFSYFLPSNFTPKILPNPSGVGAHYHMQQFHAYAGAKGYGPDLSIELTPGTSAWRLNYLNKQLNGSSAPNYGADISHITLSNSLNLGKWSNIIVHYRPATGLSGSPASNGLVEVWYWLQGDPVPSQPIKSVVGANMRNDGTNNVSQTLQHGMYRAPNDGAGTMVHYTEGFIRSSTLADALKFYASSGSTTPPPAPSPSPTPAPAPTPNPTPSPSPSPSSQTPFSSAISIPGKLEAENYDKGGEGVAYHDTDTVNQGGKYRTDGVDIENSNEGGYSIGFVNSGEWLEYSTDVAESGLYDITFRVASGRPSGTWTLKEGTTVIATANVTDTGGWYSWKDVTLKNINLSKGSHVLRLEAGGQSVNINYLTFAKQAPDGSPQPVPIPSPSPAPSPAPVPPPIEVPGSNSSNPVSIPQDLPKQSDGTIIADFNGDGLNDVAKDANNDGKIDPKVEIVIDGKTNSNFTDLSKLPVDAENYIENSQKNISKGSTVAFKPGPFPEVRIAKPVAYTFLIAQGFAITGIGSYLAITKLAFFAGFRRRLGL